MDERPIIFVTGGASGIGLATVEAVLTEGWRAVVADLDPGNLAEARRRFGERPDIRIAALDVADEPAVEREIAACEAEFGPIDGVVNSAGIGRDQHSFETGAELFRRILDVNLVGSFVVAREAARRMKGRGGGAIVNIASVSGVQGNVGRVAYGSSKGGVIAMTKIMAVELAGDGIRVNAVAPGPIETPMAREHHTPAMRKAWTSAVPQRRYGTPEEIAAAAIFLLDPAKSGYMTGQTLCVDGGFSIAGLMAEPA